MKRAKQGSSDSNSPRSKARNFWVPQLLVRLVTARSERPHACYDYTKVTPFPLDHTPWLDEKQRKVQYSVAQGRKPQIQFYWSMSGHLDPSDTITPEKNPFHVKCSDEVCFCFCATLFGGKYARLEPLECTSKKAVMCSLCEKLVKEYSKRAKELASNYPLLFASQRPKGATWLNDYAMKVAGSGNKKRMF